VLSSQSWIIPPSGQLCNRVYQQKEGKGILLKLKKEVKIEGKEGGEALSQHSIENSNK